MRKLVIVLAAAGIAAGAAAKDKPARPFVVVNEAVGVPGYCPSETGLTWDEFPDAIAGKVDSHGLHNPSTADETDALPT